MADAVETENLANTDTAEKDNDKAVDDNSIITEDVDNEKEKENKEKEHLEVIEEKLPIEKSNDTSASEVSQEIASHIDTASEIEDRFHSAPHDLEIVPKLTGHDDFEIVNTPTKLVNKAKAKIKRKSSLPGDIPDSIKEQWKKPFEIGWGREIVYRNTSQDGRRTGDVYYFSPEGKKLRSTKEVEKYLLDTSADISVGCFTFRKEPVFREPFEIIRNAKESVGGVKRLSKSSPALTDSPDKQSPKAIEKKKVKQDMARKIKMNFAKPGTNIVKLKSPHTLGLNTPKSASPKGLHTAKIISPIGDGIYSFQSLNNNGATPEIVKPKRIAVARKHTGKRKPMVVHINGNEKRQKVGENHSVAGKQRLCDFSCGNTPPSVSCEVCLCLFHPQCVGHSGSSEKFICQGCKGGDDSSSRSGVISIVPGGPGMATSPPIYGGNITQAVNSTTRIISTPNIASQLNSSNVRATILPKQIMPQTTSIVIRPSVGGPTLTSPVTLLNTNSTSTVAPPIRLSIPTGSVSPNQVSGQLITLPAHVTNKLNLQKPLNLKLNGQTFNIPPSCFIATADGVKVLLPPGSLPDNVAKGASNPLAMSTTNSGNSQQQLDVQSMVNHTSATATENSKQAGKIVDLTEDPSDTNQTLNKDKTKSDESATMKNKGKNIKIKKTESSMCHFRKLHAGFDCMIRIFQYLSLPDLLRVQQVCHTWKNVAEQNCIWRVVRLRKLQVTNWESAASHIALHRVQILDLRGMIHPNNDANRTWHQFHSALDQLENLKQIEFSGCPSSVLHAVTEKLKNLQLCTAESIVESTQENLYSNAKLDLGKFSQLKKLEVLKLRGSHGLVLPAFAFSGGLVELGKLQNLKTLALTTLRDVPAREFDFLGSLVNLEFLELGDCSEWTDEIFIQLENLKKLTSLRLEAGGDLNNESLGKALVPLQCLKHLELINFIISEKLGSSLAELKGMETFSVWPNTDVQAAKLNQNLLNAAKEMSSLKILEWGVLNDSEEGIPLLPPADADGKEGASEEGVDLLSQHVTINELIQRLSPHLPDTKIRVFKVPAALIKKVCPPKRTSTPPAVEMDAE